MICRGWFACRKRGFLIVICIVLRLGVVVVAVKVCYVSPFAIGRTDWDGRGEEGDVKEGFRVCFFLSFV